MKSSVKKFGVLTSVALSLGLILAGCGTAGQGSNGSGNSGAGSGGSGNANAASTNASSNTSSSSGSLTTVDEAIFSPPSLGAFLPVIIQAEHFDNKNGLQINFHELSPDAYNTEFASGQYPVGGSAALLSEGLRMNRGVKVSYVFNLFDFWGGLVTSNPNIKTVKDIEGKTIAAAMSTTNYAMFEYFAKQEGVDMSKVHVVNANTAALMTYALSNRADAVQLWEPGYSTLMAKSSNFHLVDFGLSKWHQYTGANKIPYLGVAVNQSWAATHQKTIQELYQTYVDAANWVTQNPDQAAQIIAKSIPGGKASVIKDLITHNDRLGMDVQPASALTNDINAVLKAGVSDGYLTSMPDSSIIYLGPLK